MDLRCIRFSVVVAVVATACSGGGSGTGDTGAPTSGGTTKTTSATSVAPALDLGALTTALKGFTGGSLGNRDVVGDDLIAAMGITEALGGDADQILRLAAGAHDAAIGQLSSTPPPVSGLRRRIGPNDVIWLIVQNDLPPLLDPATTGSHDETATNTDESTSPTPGGGAGATSTISQSFTDSVVASQVQISIHRLEKVVVTDAAGAVTFEKSDDRTITGIMRVCPDITGVSNASVHLEMTIDATTHPGANGRVGVHSVGHAKTNSAFTGQVDDSAFLQAVNQDFTRSSDWKVTAAADGGPAREHAGTLDVAFSGISTTADGAGEVSVNGLDASGMSMNGSVTGDGTQDMLTNSIGGAVLDLLTITPSYKEAQRLWRNGRCVIISAADYKAETPLPTDSQEKSQHTENVDKSSSTAFAVSLRHRFESSPLSQEVVADLAAGDKSLDPDSLPTGSGSVTYVAPDENGKDATVRLSTTSNRGIGTLVLTFHTGTLKLQVDISGTQAVADVFPSTLTITPIVLTKRPDGSFEGTGTSNMVGSLGPCNPAFTETGLIGLTATQAAASADGTPGAWSVLSEKIPSNSDVKFNCEGQTIGAILAPLGYAYNFVADLGTMTVPGEGGTLTLHADSTLGALDATVVITVLTGDG